MTFASAAKQSAWITVPLAVALAMRIAFHVGFQAGDDTIYGAFAHDIVERTYAFTPNHQALRFGLLVPVAALTALLGTSVVTLTLFSLICSLGCVGVGAWLARRLAGDGAALICGLALALIPSSVYCGTVLVPDEPVALAMTLAAALFLAGTQADRPRALWLLLASGATCGLGQTVKETAFFFLAFALLEGCLTRRWRHAALPLAGFAIVQLIECAFFLAMTGDALYRVHALSTTHVGNLHLFVHGKDAQLHAPVKMIATYPHWFGAHYIAFGVAAITLLLKRDAASRPYLRWWSVLLLLTAFWPAKLVPYMRAVPVEPRYYEPLLIPSAVLLGYAGWRLIRWRPKPAVVAIAACAAFAVLSAIVMRFNVMVGPHNDPAAYRFLRDRAAHPIVAGPSAVRSLRFLSGYRRDWLLRTEPAPEWNEYYLVWNEDRDNGSGTDDARETATHLTEQLAGLDSELLFSARPPRAVGYGKFLTGVRLRKEHGEVRIYLCRTRTP